MPFAYRKRSLSPFSARDRDTKQLGFSQAVIFTSFELSIFGAKNLIFVITRAALDPPNKKCKTKTYFSEYFLGENFCLLLFLGWEL